MLWIFSEQNLTFSNDHNTCRMCIPFQKKRWCDDFRWSSVDSREDRHYVFFPVTLASGCIISDPTASPPHSLHLSVRRVSPPPGRGASLPHPVPWAVSWLVRGGTSGGFHHRFTLGPGEAYRGKTERRTPGPPAWAQADWQREMQVEVQGRLRERRFKGMSRV